MSANDKFGLGYGDHRYDGILSYENEVLQSVFMNKESELGNTTLYDRRDGKKSRDNYVEEHIVQIVNKQNQFVPAAVLTRTGKIPVNTARASGTKNVSTARQSFNRQAVPTSTAMKVNTIKPIVNRVRPANVFHKTHSPTSRPFKKTTVLSTNLSKQKVNTAKVNAVSAVGGKRETAVKPSAGCNWRPQIYNWHNVSKYNGGSSLIILLHFQRSLSDSSQTGLAQTGKALPVNFQTLMWPCCFGVVKLHHWERKATQGLLALTFLSGLQVKQKEDGIFISQDKYVAEILKKFDFVNVKTASTPIETHKPLSRKEEP
ncbi:hypothetical protein Tco_1111810 [Tanacetum coccineum]|uniref:Uncharacterized protein n=1 Tax=Tanacetum coccineum TaxID=301880 RepID=A0ABQ5IPX8_9ASTR